jgi:hypothetical protein
MRIKLPNQEYVDIGMTMKSDAIAITTKTKWDEGSYALASIELKSDDVDRLITELVKLKSKIIEDDMTPKKSI